MKKAILITSFLLFLISCNKDKVFEKQVVGSENLIKYSKGFRVNKYEGFYVMEVLTPWPDNDQAYKYVLSKSIDLVPDSLQNIPYIQIPIQKIIPTSTTHISSIVSLEKEESVVAFPHLEYISSASILSKIENGTIKEVADKQEINFEMTLDLNPDVVVAHSTQGNNAKFSQIEKSGIPIIYNGDWVEQTPLGKAEWIKFFGLLYNEYDKAEIYFNNVVKEYEATKQLVANVKEKPLVLSGAIYENIWYAPQGESWMATFINDAKGNYIFSDTKGVGSLSLSFEEVLEKGENALVWIGPGQFDSYKMMEQTNRHYTQFLAFQQKNIYSYSIKKGPKGGIVFYEDAPNRPDLILKDLVHILHPNLLKNYTPNFIQELN